MPNFDLDPDPWANRLLWAAYVLAALVLLLT